MKRISAVLLCILILFTLCVPALAEDQRYKPLTEITEEELINCAINFARYYDDSLELSVGEIVPMYDKEDTLIGFSISYFNGETPYGDIILDFRQENPVAEFLIEENADSLYSNLHNRAEVCGSSKMAADKLYRLSYLDYAVESVGPSNEITYYNSDGRTLSRYAFLAYDDTQIALCSNTASTVVYDSHANIFNTNI